MTDRALLKSSTILLIGRKYVESNQCLNSTGNIDIEFCFLKLLYKPGRESLLNFLVVWVTIIFTQIGKEDKDNPLEDN
jgi:hypothetical protein